MRGDERNVDASLAPANRVDPVEVVTAILKLRGDHSRRGKHSFGDLAVERADPTRPELPALQPFGDRSQNVRQDSRAVGKQSRDGATGNGGFEKSESGRRKAGQDRYLRSCC